MLHKLKQRGHFVVVLDSCCLVPHLVKEGQRIFNLCRAQLYSASGVLMHTAHSCMHLFHLCSSMHTDKVLFKICMHYVRHTEMQISRTGYYSTQVWCRLAKQEPTQEWQNAKTWCCVPLPLHCAMHIVVPRTMLWHDSVSQRCGTMLWHKRVAQCYGTAVWQNSVAHPWMKHAGALGAQLVA